MGERLSQEEFAARVATQSTERLEENILYYRGYRNSGIKRLALGAVAAGGVVATVLATRDEAWRYVAMGELFVAGVSSMTGIVRFGTGRLSERIAKEELENRSRPTGFLSESNRQLMDPNFGREGLSQIEPLDFKEPR